jgi:hypothetical protein
MPALLGRDGTTIRSSERDDDEAVVRTVSRPHIAHDTKNKYYSTVAMYIVEDDSIISHYHDFSPCAIHAVYLVSTNSKRMPQFTTTTTGSTSSIRSFSLASRIGRMVGCSVRRSAMTSTTGGGRKTAPVRRNHNRQTTAAPGRPFPSWTWGVVAVRVHVSGKSCSSQYRYVPEYAHVQPCLPFV